MRSKRAGGATSPTADAPLQPRFRHSRAGGNPATSPSAKSGTSALGPRLRGDDGQDKASRRTIAGVSMTHPVLTGLGLSDNDSGTYLGNGEWPRWEEHTSELQSLMRQSYATVCLNNK